MAWPLQFSQRPQQQPNAKGKPKKRVSFAPNQPTGCPPTSPTQQGAKQVRFSTDTKPGSRGTSSGRSAKTRWPSPSKPTPPTPPRPAAPGLSSVKRDFENKKPALRTSRPAPKTRSVEPPPPPPRSTRASRTTKPNARLTIPVRGEPYNGPPKTRHQRAGYDWVPYEVRVKVTATAKDWRREGWAK